MHIGIDARFYGSSAKGLGRYVQQLLAHLESIPNEHHFTVLLKEENWDVYQPKDSRFRKVHADIPWYSVQEQVQLPKLLKAQHCDLWHFPHYNVPLFTGVPYVITIHDLIVSRFPTRRASTLGPIKFFLKQAAYRTVINSAVHRAKSVLTVSEFSKHEILAHFGIPEDRVTVTYEAADPVASTTISTAAHERVRPWGSFLMYVGNAYPHKNLEGLLDAYVLLRKRVPEAPKLVLVGKMEYFYERLVQRAKELGLGDSVIFPGYLTDEELQAAYAHATLYVFPSFDEGFGLPPLEAMRAGVPVASSNASCLPEVLGDAAAYFTPHDSNAIVSALERLLGDEHERATLRAKGFVQADRYSWDTLAQKTLDVYTAVVKENA